MLIGTKRIYDKASITDGKRVFIDRLWPRGVKKSTANIDIWMKEIAPSNGLRMWFNHDPEKWDAFKAKYLEELEANAHSESIIELVEKNDVTLLYAAQDTEHNNAVVLSEFIKARVKS